MMRGLVVVVVAMAVLGGCVSGGGTQVDFNGNPVRIGGYAPGQFDVSSNNANFIKLSQPESDEFNPRLAELRFWNVPESDWYKACEWHPVSRY